MICWDSFVLSSTVGMAYTGVVLKCQFGGNLQTYITLNEVVQALANV